MMCGGLVGRSLVAERPLRSLAIAVTNVSETIVKIILVVSAKVLVPDLFIVTFVVAKENIVVI
jgi:hypothetical protein